MDGYSQFTATVTTEQKQRKEKTGLTWAEILELGLKTAEKVPGSRSRTNKSSSFQ